MTDAVKDQMLGPVDRFEDYALRPQTLHDELNALLVMAKGIEQRHARELAATKTHIGDGRYWTMATDMTAIIESIEEALGTYDRAEIHPIR